jgi:hypothetical protein
MDWANTEELKVDMASAQIDAPRNKVERDMSLLPKNRHLGRDW